MGPDAEKVMKKEIVTDTKILSKLCFECNINDPVLQKEINHLIDTATSLRTKCAGLAFNQIGIIKRGFVIKYGIEHNFKPIINPKYIMKSPTVKARFESCLSRPGMDPIKKRRSVKIKIEYYDPEAKEIKQEIFRAFDARVVQHEMDHLNGILI